MSVPRPQIVAFLNSLVGQCEFCHRKYTSACGQCPAPRAKTLLMEIQAESAQDNAPDYSASARMARIEAILANASRPLSSVEIDLHDLCPRQVKYWTLQQLVRIKRITRRRDKTRGIYLYTLNRRLTT